LERSLVAEEGMWSSTKITLEAGLGESPVVIDRRGEM
jgi:hypothetical protein